MGHGVAAKQGTEFLDMISSFSGYLFFRACLAGEMTIQMDPKALNIARPGQGSITYIQSVGEPSASGEDYSLSLIHI